MGVTVATDGLTRWTVVQAVPAATAWWAAKFIMERVVATYGVPLVVLTDQGKHFQANFTVVLQQLGVQHHHATAYNPRAMGIVERTNGILMERVKRWGST